MPGKVIFKRPIILDGLLDFYKPSLGREKYRHFQDNAKEARQVSGNGDSPVDIINVPIRFSEKYYPDGHGSVPDGSSSVKVAYRVKYEGIDILIGDKEHQMTEEISVLPDELFVIEE